ncbi:hypothetical protein IAR55_005451 [Kwoniella newhampshirensis]|uniref:Uncharacterized protein n=1 Tax=Kwoniella newhampshirensis TaxID=1651941 RepID=A0AAW0YHE5_9TREE
MPKSNDDQRPSVYRTPQEAALYADKSSADSSKENATFDGSATISPQQIAFSTQHSAEISLSGLRINDRSAAAQSYEPGRQRSTNTTRPAGLKSMSTLSAPGEGMCDSCIWGLLLIVRRIQVLLSERSKISLKKTSLHCRSLAPSETPLAGGVRTEALSLGSRRLSPPQVLKVLWTD